MMRFGRFAFGSIEVDGTTSEHDSLPVVDELAEEAKRRGIELLVLPLSEAIEELQRAPTDTNAILHVTC